MKSDNPSVASAAFPSSSAASLASGVGFDLLGEALGQAVGSALEEALPGGAGFAEGAHPLTIFRKTLAGSICSIEDDPRGGVFHSFLLDGSSTGGREAASGPGDQAGRIQATLEKEEACPAPCRHPLQLLQLGYSLGMNYRDKEGRREMLWPEDLDETAVKGCLKNGSRIV